MRPSHKHAPGMPNRLPYVDPVFDAKGVQVAGGQPEAFQKVLASLKSHHADELKKRTRDEG